MAHYIVLDPTLLYKKSKRYYDFIDLIKGVKREKERKQDKQKGWELTIVSNCNVILVKEYLEYIC